LLSYNKNKYWTLNI